MTKKYLAPWEGFMEDTVSQLILISIIFFERKRNVISKSLFCNLKLTLRNNIACSE